MALTQRALAPGVTAYFAREGATVAAGGVVSATNKPISTDLVAWLNVGIVEDGQWEHPFEEKVIRAPMPGAKRAINVVQQNHDEIVSLNIEEVTLLTLSLLFGTAQLATAATQFNPLSNVKPVRGWLKVQIADSEDVPLLTSDLWVRLRLASAIPLPAGAETMKSSLEGLVLHSLLNTTSI